MTQVSRRPIKDETLQKIDQLLLESITSCHTKESINEFLDDILTPTEKIMLSKRLAIAYLLRQGHSYEVINKTLKVSNPTIRAVAIIMQLKGKGLKRALIRVTQKQQLKNFLKGLVETALDILQEGKGGDWKTAKAAQFQRKLDKQSPLH